ncbi:hypothetical protein AOQ84DRAFT_411037 [Glonium stellatum]|uniref:ER-bound oxygenase mpaB/mpaB'/Rubber oxygenase catalytic domain-containing protein n=1 Tax=Glonium stellatum TaxID=574774 RepID=A0A8E2FBQ9_9PEZI|nr:hypothetical protein AOQ84DRAFT_411037 [Glonium stellatum]
MACAFATAGTQNPHIPEHNEKADISAPTSGAENFHPDFLSPSFNPKEMRKIVSEGTLLAGGGAAILLQVANPGVGAGVNEHSNFAYRPLDRLRTTMTYVYCMAYGTPKEKRTIINMVHRAHAPVKGAGYIADDIFGKLDYATSEAVYKQYSVLASSSGVPPELWPKTRKDFWEYWDRMVDTMEITPHAVNVATDLLRNKDSPLWIRLNLPLIRLLTAEWLAPRMRDAYGLKSTKSRRAVYKLTMAMMKTTYPIMPKFVRHFPLHYYLKDMRKRMRHMDHIIGPDNM